MSRSKEKLQKVASEIREQFKKEVIMIPVDFSSGHSIYSEISAQLQGLDVGILVNNVGAAMEFDIFGNHTPEMTHLVLPGMLKKKSGIIVNISSAASMMSMPQMSLYSSTKIFTNYISDGIRKEYSSSGVIVQTVTPFFVSTPIPSSLSIPDALTYTRSAVGTIGIQDNTYGYLPHAIQGFLLFSFFPSFLTDWYLWKVTNAGKERARRRRAKAKSNQNTASCDCHVTVTTLYRVH